MGEYRIAAIGGDGIGPEVVEAGVEVLNAVAEIQKMVCEAIGSHTSNRTGVKPYYTKSAEQ